MLRTFGAETKLSYSAPAKPPITPTRIKPIQVLEPVTKRCHQGARSTISSFMSQHPHRLPGRSCRVLACDRAGHRADDVLHRHVGALVLRDPFAQSQHLDA